MLPYSSLPPRLACWLGPECDPFVVRLLSRTDEEITAECSWRATGQWDCNERESHAAYRALADIAAGLPGPAPLWGAAEYAAFRSYDPLPA